MIEIKIETNIPLPENYAPIKKYPFEDMKVGDSFYVEYTCHGNIGQIRSAMTKACKDDKRFISRSTKKDDEVVGMRVWRVE